MLYVRQIHQVVSVQDAIPPHDLVVVFALWPHRIDLISISSSIFIYTHSSSPSRWLIYLLGGLQRRGALIRQTHRAHMRQVQSVEQWEKTVSVLIIAIILLET